MSFITAPIVVQRENCYVLFVTDVALASATQSYEWTFTENGNVTRVETTQDGEMRYTPQTLGILSLSVSVLGVGGAEQAALVLKQEVVFPSLELETLIDEARDKPGAVAANPEVLRELVNEHSRYYQTVKLQTLETGDAFLRFTYSFVFEGALQRTPGQRRQHGEQLAASLNDSGAGFAELARQGVGVCALRLPLLAMNVPKAPGGPDTLLPWTELPESANPRTFAEVLLRQSLATLDETARLDLFNMARFPKSNITLCARILEALRDHYFPGKNFSDVITGMSGTRAHWITRHYKEGPLKR